MKKNSKEIIFIVILLVLIGVIMYKNRKIRDLEMVLEQCSDRYYKEIGVKNNSSKYLEEKLHPGELFFKGIVK